MHWLTVLNDFPFSKVNIKGLIKQKTEIQWLFSSHPFPEL